MKEAIFVAYLAKVEKRKKYKNKQENMTLINK